MGKRKDKPSPAPEPSKEPTLEELAAEVQRKYPIEERYPELYRPKTPEELKRRRIIIDAMLANPLPDDVADAIR